MPGDPDEVRNSKISCDIIIINVFIQLFIVVHTSYIDR